MIVIEKGNDYIKIADVNYDLNTCKINFGRKITKEELEKQQAWYIRRY